MNVAVGRLHVTFRFDPPRADPPPHPVDLARVEREHHRDQVYRQVDAERLYWLSSYRPHR